MPWGLWADSVRILFVSPGRTLESGASQTAATLAREMEARGHQTLLWIPEPPRWQQPPWFHRRLQARELVKFVRGHGPIDVVDTFPVLVSRALRSSTTVVSRSVQPDLLYLEEELKGIGSQLRNRRWLVDRTTIEILKRRVKNGYRNSHRVLALGKIEAAWLANSFPDLCERIGTYDVAPPAEDQRRLADLRAQRGQSATKLSGHRYLWLGRWAHHKGPQTLLSWASLQLRTRPQDSLTIAGYSTLTQRAKAPLETVSSQVRWIPKYSREQLPILLGSHDFGVFTSTVEGWGLSLNEMLESGLVVFATEAGGVGELRAFFPNQLRTFPPRDLNERPLDDPSQTGYYRRWNWSAIASAYEQELQAAIAARMRRPE